MTDKTERELRSYIQTTAGTGVYPRSTTSNHRFEEQDQDQDRKSEDMHVKKDIFIISSFSASSPSVTIVIIINERRCTRLLLFH